MKAKKIGTSVIIYFFDVLMGESKLVLYLGCKITFQVKKENMISANKLERVQYLISDNIEINLFHEKQYTAHKTFSEIMH